MRRGMNEDATIMAGTMLLRIALDTTPGRSALGSALRDSRVWPNSSNVLYGQVDLRTGVGTTMFGFQYRVEEMAEREHARRVGERHVAAAFVEMGDNAFGQFGLQPKRLLDAVTLLELGPAFQPVEIEGRWHGLIDTSIAIEYRDIQDIDWLAETGAKQATIWISPVLLDELDDMKFHSRNERVRHRADAFTRWINPLLDGAVKSGGAPMPKRAGVALRAWAPTLGLVAPDSRHLEAAYALLDRRVPIKLVTGDSGQRLRALAHGIGVFDLDPRYRWQSDQAATTSPVAAANSADSEK
jgi:PIN domain-containing protein